MVRDQALLLGCKIANERRAFLTEMVRKYHHEGISVPLVSSNMRLVHSYASELDDRIRQNYSSRIKYGNRTANIEAIQKVNVSEVNRLAFFEDKNCLNWLVNEVKEQIKMKRFRSCKRFIITREDILESVNVRKLK